MIFEVLESKLQLHERFEILYVVDGYIATFSNADGDNIVAKTHGSTIVESIEKLELLIKDYDRVSYWESRK